MNITLTSKRIEKLSSFCLDISKGLMLAGLLGQNFVNLEGVYLKILGNVAIIAFSLLFLAFSLILDRK